MVTLLCVEQFSSNHKELVFYKELCHEQNSLVIKLLKEAETQDHKVNESVSRCVK